jgi:hypothetical protein
MSSLQMTALTLFASTSAPEVCAPSIRVANNVDMHAQDQTCNFDQTLGTLNGRI